MESTKEESIGSSRVKLNGPSDWKQWISIIQKFAIAHGIWDFVDPSRPLNPAPREPRRPEPSDLQDEATLVTLNPDKIKTFELLTSQYRHEYSIFKARQKALASLQEHIVRTCGNYYNTIAYEHDVAKELKVLKQRIQPTSWAQEQDVLDRFHSTLKSPNRTKISDWVTKWHQVLTEAQQLGIPDAQGLRPTRLFLKAVSGVNPTFSHYWLNKMEDEARGIDPLWQGRFPDGIEISTIFERAHSLTSDQKGGKGGNTFATWQQTCK
ncbi:uncharacterized protein HRG_11945 [Hirsutella rhossiliensis]|uniref:Uncharacterized protein n=1 Tax=Hirsutella rhossiliensis TaxID=111463 RepID=A0A9P8SBY1_9HYPO|nr:uncharacterized protein HRG_11945 [Hirsutella rhossiliensis]KAH0956986.1 hypothetical protein HRG_11945 [Hirsutella rhossiliensis]